MKKFLFGAMWALSVCIPLLISVPAHAATVNDFTIDNYHISYYLSRSSSGHSTLKTVEDITADFPYTDQNHGIERAVPKDYDGHATKLSVVSVTDGSGQNRPYTTYDSNGNLVIRIGDAGTYVHGQQDYEITYSQADVTKFFNDTGSDEFYWDTDGTGWQVPISQLSVDLHMSQPLQSALTGNQHCYFGAQGSTESCDVLKTSDGFNLQASGLAPGQNATIAVGFKPGTFAAYHPSLGERLLQLWTILLGATFFISAVAVIWFIVRYYRVSNRTAEHHSIIPEYVPPKDTSVAASARIYRKGRAPFGAQLIDFAVRGYIKIYQTREKSLFRPAQYELEIIKDISGLKAEEKELFDDIFPATAVGTRLPLSDLKNNTAVALRLSDNPSKLDSAIKSYYGLRAKDPIQRGWFKRAGLICLIAAVVTVSPWLLAAAITAFILAYLLYPLTDKGLDLYHYLEGLKMYIRVAETDRIRMLQGPDTAEKIGAPVDTNDQRQLVKLYERVLPYAMLFGLEKKWNDRLGQYYAQLNEQPLWFVGNQGVFNAAVFSSALNNFNTAASYSTGSSSMSGGSMGGGFSGGGGGGGGGGGW